MARNKLSDLNDHLFEQLERLNDDEYMSDADLNLERMRTQSICNVSEQILKTHRTQIEAVRTINECGGIVPSLPETFGIKEAKKEGELE